MGRKVVAGNWKMNLGLAEGVQLVKEIEANYTSNDEIRVMAFVPSLFVSTLADTASSLEIGVQNFYHESKGAFTGEISIEQVTGCGAFIGLIGHSERRSIFGETNELLKAKVDAAVANEFEFIFCCGEPLEVREAGNENDHVRQQLEESLFHLSANDMKEILIAYEPVWAIGTGKTASTQQAEDMHSAIRSWISEKYGEDIADSVSILYGGSCNPQNASELFACENVDGGLIGGASLKADSFCSIINA